MRNLQAAKLEQLKQLTDSEHACGTCHEKISQTASQLSFAACPEVDCRAIFHLSCLALSFLEKEGASGHTRALLPTVGLCPCCHMEHHWGEYIKGSQFRDVLLNRGGKFVEIADVSEEESGLDSESATCSDDSQKTSLSTPRQGNAKKSDAKTSVKVATVKSKAIGSHSRSKTRSSNEAEDLNVINPKSQEITTKSNPSSCSSSIELSTFSGTIINLSD